MSDTVIRVELAGRVIGLYALDPGDGRWLWSVRWPRNARKGWAKTRFRYGKADTEAAAIEAIHEAHGQGRPELEPIE